VQRFVLGLLLVGTLGCEVDLPYLSNSSDVSITIAKPLGGQTVRMDSILPIEWTVFYANGESQLDASHYEMYVIHQNSPGTGVREFLTSLRTTSTWPCCTKNKAGSITATWNVGAIRPHDPRFPTLETGTYTLEICMYDLTYIGRQFCQESQSFTIVP